MTKIVIAGAGFGGVRVALDLSKYLPNEKITLINDTPYHCYHADLYEVATSLLKKERKIDFKNLSGTINIPLKTIFRHKNVEVLEDTITEIDLRENIVTTQNSKALEYDYLVLSLGSVTNYFDIEGAKDYSHPLKTAEDALNIRNDLEELIISSNKVVSVAIAGGGYTGVELAGQLVSFLNKLSKLHQKEDGKILLLEATQNLLGGMPSWSQRLALTKLKGLGVKVLLDLPINKVTASKIYSNQTEIDFDYLIWTTGVNGDNLNDQIKGISFTQRKKVETNQNLSLEKYPNLFVLGDLAECLDQKRGCPVAATAWAAIGQGEIVAKNIVAKIKNRSTQDYVPPNPVFVVPIGRKYALSNFADLKITGILGWFLKRMIALKYFLSILPFFDAISIWRKGVRIYLAND